MGSTIIRRGVAAAAGVLLASALLPINAQAAPPGVRVAEAANSLRASLGAEGIVEIDRDTATLRRLARLDGYLTKPSAAAPERIARDYLAAHRSVVGLTAAEIAALRLRKDYVDIEGTHHLSFVQRVNGVDVVGNGLKAHLTRDGRLIAVDGVPLAGLPATLGAARVDAVAAHRAAVRTVSGTTAATVRSRTTSSATFSDGGRARQVVFNTNAGPRLAWEVIDMDGGYLSVVDAADGGVLFQRSMVANHHATTWQNYPGAPVGGTQRPVDLNRWLPPNATRLEGNVGHVYSDVNADNVAQASEEVTPNAASSFDFPFTNFSDQVGAPCSAQRQCSWNPAVPYSWQTNREQNAAQLFAFLGTWHDHLAAAPIGFTRAAGNFEAVDGDAVVAEAMDGADTANGLPDSDHDNNANMTTPPDGMAPRMQMYLFVKSASVLAGNSGDTADILYHEYTHGLSDRLVVDANGNSTLISAQAQAMYEAWSDWYGLDYLVDSGLERDDAIDGDVREGDYILGGRSVRSEAMDCPVGSTEPVCAGNPAAGSGGYTYGDYGKIRNSSTVPGTTEPEIHADGEIWAQTLWDLRAAIGSRLARSLITRAMELSPADPSYLDMRDAILLADRVVNHGRGQREIWRVFAARGMGVHASTDGAGDTTPTEDFSVPRR
ncbi:M36 family metallopeptidase [Micromonospora sp. CA-249363]|uniref:M36 family metallopeptidase n=1 Tax=Micromonospora sp. CA-249363 TaxID=3239963 RepID=UPI003D8DAD3D